MAAMTVRRSLQELVDEGVLIRMRGRGHGTYVTGMTSTAKKGGAKTGRLARIAVLHSYERTSLSGDKPFYRLFLDMQMACSMRHIEICFISADQFRGDALLNRIRGERCQCVAVLDWYRAEELLQIQNSGIPVVALGPFLEQECLSYVCSNDFLAASLITRYLKELGHNRIAFVQDRKESKTSLYREAGWKMALNLASEASQLTYFVGRSLKSTGQVFDEIREELRAQFKAKEPPTAIFARDGFFAQATIAALAEIGRKCPGDVSVACVGNSFEFDPQSPIVTSAHLPAGLLGHTAILLAEDLLSGRVQGPLGVELMPKISVGQTTRAI